MRDFRLATRETPGKGNRERHNGEKGTPWFVPTQKGQAAEGNSSCPPHE